MVFTTDDELYHNTNNIYHICNKQCINIFRGHCHKKGKYRSPACKICNLNYTDEIFITDVFHNGKGYDLNLQFAEIL